MYYLMYTMLTNNTWKGIGSLFTSLVFSLFILLSIFRLHACDNYLVARSTYCDFVLSFKDVISAWYKSSPTFLYRGFQIN